VSVLSEEKDGFAPYQTIFRLKTIRNILVSYLQAFDEAY